MTFLRHRLFRTSRPVLDRARPTDAPAIGAILSDWIDETDWMPRIHKREDEQAFAADLVARGWVTVARRRGEVVYPILIQILLLVRYSLILYVKIDF